MKKRIILYKTLCILCTLFFLLPVCTYGEIVGEINSISGTVKIDAFGKKTFIQAIEGDGKRSQCACFGVISAKQKG